MTTELKQHIRNDGTVTAVGTWDAFRQQLPWMPEVPTQDDLAKAGHAEIAYLAPDGQILTMRIGYLGTPKEYNGVLRCFAIRLATPKPTRSGPCANCGRHDAALVECHDSSDLSGWCCRKCAADPSEELSFA